VESLQTKNKLEETQLLTRGLAAAAVDAARGLEKTKIVMLASIHFLLGASPDLLDEDIIKELEHTQRWLSKDVSGEDVSMSDKLMVSVEKSESEDDAAIEDAVAEQVGETDVTESERGKEYVRVGVKQIEGILESWQPAFQEKILQVLIAGQPKRRAEREAEDARDEARDNFINYCLNNLSRAEEKELYEKLLADVKAGKASVADAA
jgi:hypothetical protein